MGKLQQTARLIEQAARLTRNMPASQRQSLGGMVANTLAMRAGRRLEELANEPARLASSALARSGGRMGALFRSLIKTNDPAQAFIAGLQSTGAGNRELANQVQRFAKGYQPGDLLADVLARLGTTGKVMAWLLGRGSAPSVGGVSVRTVLSAVELLESLGFEVRFPGGVEQAVKTTQTRQPRAPKILLPGARLPQAPGERPRIVLPNEPQLPEEPTAPIRPNAPIAPGSRIDKLNKPTAEPQTTAQPEKEQVEPPGFNMVRVQSSNVYAIGYQASTNTMRVQYIQHDVLASGLKGRMGKKKASIKGRLGRTVAKSGGGPGPLYDYFDVPKRVYARIASAGSKGGAIWDNLRVRGTIYGHRYDYRLVEGGMANVIGGGGRQWGPVRIPGKIMYVPRKAVAVGVFKLREIKRGGERFKSLLPSQGLPKTGQPL